MAQRQVGNTDSCLNAKVNFHNTVFLFFYTLWPLHKVNSQPWGTVKCTLECFHRLTLLSDSFFSTGNHHDIQSHSRLHWQKKWFYLVEHRSYSYFASISLFVCVFVWLRWVETNLLKPSRHKVVQTSPCFWPKSLVALQRGILGLYKNGRRSNGKINLLYFKTYTVFWGG